MNYDNQEGLARALFEESGDALFLFDPETDRLLDANAKAQRLTGLSLRDLLSLPMDQLFRFGGSGGLRRVREAAGKSGTFHSQDGYYLRTDRPETYLPVNLTISRLHVKTKTLALFTAHAVREQRGTSAQLERAEEELRRVLASVSDCLWTAEVDTAGHWTYRSFSPVVEKLTGQPSEWFLAGVHRWWSIIHAADQPRWEKAVIRLRSGQPTQEEYRVVCPDGGCRWVRESIQVSGAGDGRRLRLDGVISDITDRKILDERPRAGDQLLREFLDGCPAPAFLKDPAGRFVHVNRAFAALCGWAPAEMLGRTDAEVLTAEVARTLFPRAAAQGKEVLEVRTADGVLRRWLVLCFPVRVGEGQQLQGGLALDLTGCAIPWGELPRG